MKRSTASALIAIGMLGLCAACNFIIAADFEGAKPGNPYGADCQLTGDAGTPCGECIATQCKTDLDIACTNGNTKSWYTQMKGCADRPYLNQSSSGYGCSGYLSEAGVHIDNPATDDEKKQNAAVCIRDKCLSGDGAKCRTCDIHYKGESQDYSLAGTKCGNCVFSKCYQEIMATCSAGTASSILSPCAFPGIGENGTKCAAAVRSPDAGSYPAERTLHTCLQQCETECTQ